jgi:hypothetical protein
MDDDKAAIGTLSLNGLGRWEILRQGRQPYELSSGSVFLLEVDGVLRRTSIEFRHFTGRHPKGLAGEYYSPDGYQLTGGLRAAPPGDAEDGQALQAHSDRLTPAEIALRRQRAKESSAYFRREFAKMPRKVDRTK